MQSISEAQTFVHTDPLTFFVVGVHDEAAAQGAGRVHGAVLGHGAETRLTEDVTAGLTAVRAEEDVQAHGAGETFGVSLLLFLLRTVRHSVIPAPGAAGAAGSSRSSSFPTFCGSSWLSSHRSRLRCFLRRPFSRFFSLLFCPLVLEAWVPGEASAWEQRGRH